MFSVARHCNYYNKEAREVQLRAIQNRHSREVREVLHKLE